MSFGRGKSWALIVVAVAKWNKVFRQLGGSSYKLEMKRYVSFSMYKHFQSFSSCFSSLSYWHIYFVYIKKVLHFQWAAGQSIIDKHRRERELDAHSRRISQISHMAQHTIVNKESRYLNTATTYAKTYISKLRARQKSPSRELSSRSLMSFNRTIEFVPQHLFLLCSLFCLESTTTSTYRYELTAGW